MIGAPDRALDVGQHLTQRAPRTSVAARPPSVSSTVWAWPVSTNQPNAPSPSVKASASGANRRFDPSVIDALSNDVPKRGLRSAAASSPGTRCRSALSSGGGRRCIGSRAPRAGTGNGPDVHTPGTGSLSANATGTTPADTSASVEYCARNSDIDDRRKSPVGTDPPGTAPSSSP